MDYDNIISLIYEASYKPEHWENVLEAITKLTESRSDSDPDTFMDYENIVRLIYKASYNPEYREDVLEAITNLTESRSASFLYAHHGQLDSSISFMYHLGQEP